MPRKTRRTKTSSGSLFAWPRILLIIVPLFAAVLIMFNSENGRTVLGVSDTNLLNLNREHKDASSSGKVKCNVNRISAFSVTGLCASGRAGFTKASYTCEDGTTGSVSKDCMNVQSAYERALKACAKNTKCVKVEAERKLSPKPTHAEPSHAESGL